MAITFSALSFMLGTIFHEYFKEVVVSKYQLWIDHLCRENPLSKVKHRYDYLSWPLDSLSPLLSRALQQLWCYHCLSLYWHSHFHGMPVVNLLLHGASATNCTVYVNLSVWRCWHGRGISWSWMERVMGQSAGVLTLINCLLVSDGAQERVWGCKLSGTEVWGGPTPIMGLCQVLLCDWHQCFPSHHGSF